MKVASCHSSLGLLRMHLQSGGEGHSRQPGLRFCCWAQRWATPCRERDSKGTAPSSQSFAMHLLDCGVPLACIVLAVAVGEVGASCNVQAGRHPSPWPATSAAARHTASPPQISMGVLLHLNGHPAQDSCCLAAARVHSKNLTWLYRAGSAPG